MKHRLKMSAFLLLQICPDDSLVEKIKKMNPHELVGMRVALMEVLNNTSEYTINLESSNMSSSIIDKVLGNSRETLDSAILRSSGGNSP